MDKTILITGASSGFGKLTVHKFHEEGWNVVATMRSPEKKDDFKDLENVMVSKLDVTDINTIEETVNQVISRFGRIDVLVNNAGFGGYGLIEQFDDQDIRNLFETNVFGVINVTKAVLPVMRPQKSGTIINITSIAGFVGSPMVSVYSSSKFAVEGLTEALAFDYKALGIKVKSIAPGSFATGFISSANRGIEKGTDAVKSYAKTLSNHINQVRENMRAVGGKTPDPMEVAEKIFQCATTDTPIHNYVGSDSEMLAKMKNSMHEQDFLEQMANTLLPKE